MLYFRNKQAITTETGGMPSRFTANTLGQLGNLLSIVQPMVSARTFVNPDVASTTDIANKMDMAEPERLDNTKIRVGGSDTIDDLIWKKEEEGEDLPWYGQLGGRLVHNPRTTVLGKLLGAAGYPISWAVGNLMRGSHYNPATDTAQIYADEPGIIQHEIGHALDYNAPINKQKGLTGIAKRYGSAAARDLYTLLRVLPFADVYQELEANRHSLDALKKVLSEEELRQALKDRAKVLPAGLGSYVGGAADKFMGTPFGIGGVAGTLVGKVQGLAERRRLSKEDKHKEKQAADLISSTFRRKVGSALLSTVLNNMFGAKGNTTNPTLK